MLLSTMKGINDETESLITLNWNCLVVIAIIPRPPQFLPWAAILFPVFAPSP